MIIRFTANMPRVAPGTAGGLERSAVFEAKPWRQRRPITDPEVLARHVAGEFHSMEELAKAVSDP